MNLLLFIIDKKNFFLYCAEIESLATSMLKVE